jgi:hypothetical protein
MTRRTISLDELDGFEIDEATGHLYWRDQRVKTEARFSLSTWQRIGAILVTASAIVGSGAAVASAIADWVR